MSHISKVELQITDLDAVRALCKENGWTFKHGQKTCRYWNGAEHPCDHAIGVPGSRDASELGLVQNKDGKGFSLAFDPMCFTGIKGIGENGTEFKRGYGVCKIEQIAKTKNYKHRRIMKANGSIQVILTGGAW